MLVSTSPRFLAASPFWRGLRPLGAVNFLGPGSALKFPGTCRLYSTRKSPSDDQRTLNKKINSKLNKKQLLEILVILISVSLLFAFPLKILCKLCGAPFFVSLGLSGFIAYVNTKLYQLLKNKNIDTSLIEFFRIFSINICLMFLMVVLGYPFILASLFLVIHSEELLILFKDLFHKIFMDKYLYMGDHMPPYEVSDKPGKSILDVAQVSNMDGTRGESSKSSNLEGRNLDGNNSRPQPGPLEGRNLGGNNSRPLPDPLFGRCNGKYPNFQIGLT